MEFILKKKTRRKIHSMISNVHTAFEKKVHVDIWRLSFFYLFARKQTPRMNPKDAMLLGNGSFTTWHNLVQSASERDPAVVDGERALDGAEIVECGQTVSLEVSDAQMSQVQK